MDKQDLIRKFRLARKQKDRKQLLMLARKAVQMDPTDRQLRTSAAEGFLRATRLEEAEGILGPLLREIPDDPWLLTLNGDLLTARRRWDEAAGQYERALELRPGAIFLYRRLARFFVRRGEPKKALQWAHEGLDVRPSDPGLLDAIQRAEMALEHSASTRVVN
jgi:predicted Zn-dependent protease